MSTGRGGAGNILAVQQEKAQVSGDVEANLRQTLESPILQQAQSQTQAQYAHSGRGGAGNYYSPKDLKETGRFSHQNTGTSSSTSSQAAHAAPVARYGRGGAGNMSFGVTANEEKAAEAERVQRMKIEAESEREAEQSIVMPPRAKLPLSSNEASEPF
jgi:hypothetical protein